MHRVTKISILIGTLVAGLVAGAGAAIINAYQFATHGIWTLPYLFFFGVIGITGGIISASSPLPLKLRITALCVATCCIIGLVLWIYVNHKLGADFVRP